MTFTLPKLQYSLADLEPHISADLILSLNNNEFVD